ncbi:protein-glutamate O-methyltransferase CheR [Lysinibacillus sp. BW-2-10]|uniref:CheR family methyltransferase n=1 Tax=Lysinibacillus sp. BW-2-10 TaxID=2590030 RepID=UPI00117D5B90|nr:protein-glutamate O-methyltransferase CheR [Lysinibacillus sp. BW-2-10]TSI02644.1 protein-glutamate O-methyltransferase CheR [Lysinibacillus sp. BW-2-10]
MESFTLKQLGQLVYYYCGLNYLNNIDSLETKITPRLQSLSLSLWEYMKFLDNNPNEWDQLVEILTINETYFFREDKQLTYFKDNILPKLKNRNSNKPIKIWSAACSTGEEPYSLAMLILDSGLIEPKKVQIIGTDINKKVLTIAKNGTYSKRSLSFRRIPPEWLNKYFREEEDAYKVKDSIKDMVDFHYVNLLDKEKMSMYHDFDIIFCRNVLIYFDQETIRKVASSFYQSLVKGGYLFLGHAENISNMNIGFNTISTEGAFFYRKGE